MVKSVKSCDVVKDKVKAGIYEGIEEDLIPFYEALSSYKGKGCMETGPLPMLYSLGLKEKL